MTLISAMGLSVLGLSAYIRQIHAARIQDLRDRIAAERECAEHADIARQAAIAHFDSVLQRMQER